MKTTPDRLGRVLEYCRRRAAYLDLRDRVTAVLMADLPGIRPRKATRTAEDVLDRILGGGPPL